MTRGTSTEHSPPSLPLSFLQLPCHWVSARGASRRGVGSAVLCSQGLNQKLAFLNQHSARWLPACYTHQSPGWSKPEGFSIMKLYKGCLIHYESLTKKQRAFPPQPGGKLLPFLEKGLGNTQLQPYSQRERTSPQAGSSRRRGGWLGDRL